MLLINQSHQSTFVTVSNISYTHGGPENFQKSFPKKKKTREIFFSIILRKICYKNSVKLSLILNKKFWPTVPGFKSRPSWGFCSSFPVESKAIVGRFFTLISVAPTVAKMPISAGPRVVPWFKTVLPFSISDPRGLISWPLSTGVVWTMLISSSSVPSWDFLVSSVSSTCITASAPLGTGAPIDNINHKQTVELYLWT